MSFDPGAPTLDQLQVFLTVVDTGSFAGAARRLGRAKSVVSYSIANLEAQLGVLLFDRTSTRSFIRIPAGYVPEILRLASGPAHDLLPQLVDPNGDITIGPVPADVPVNLLANLQPLSETRDLGGFSARQHDFIHDLQYKSGLKNLGGTMVLSMTIPAYDRMVKAYWEVEDLRTGLLNRVKAPAA